MREKVKVFVKKTDGSEVEFDAEKGANLRRELIKNGCSPYVSITSKLNCGGRGLCATCGVFVRQDVPPKHWHDRLAKQFHYPRLSCQIALSSDLRVEIPSKVIWGSRRKMG